MLGGWLGVSLGATNATLLGIALGSERSNFVILFLRPTWGLKVRTSVAALVTVSLSASAV